MPTLELQARTQTIVPDKAIDDQLRSLAALAGKRGDTVVETTLFDDHKPTIERVGFHPPVRKPTTLKDTPEDASQTPLQTEAQDIHGEIHDFLKITRLLGEA